MWRRILSNREAMTVLVFAAANGVLGLVANRLVTQAIAPDQLGELYLLTNLVLWLALPGASVSIYVQRHWAVAREFRLGQRFARGAMVALLAQTIVAVIASIAFRQLRVSGVETWTIAGLIAIAAVAQSAMNSVAPVQVAERRRISAGVLDLLANAVRQIALAAAAILFGIHAARDLLVVQTVYMAFVGVVVVLAMFQLLRGTRDAPDPARAGLRQISLRAVLGYSVPFGAAAAIAQVSSSAERWGLARLDHPAATALFVQSVALSMAVVAAATGFLSTYYYPIIAQVAAATEDPLHAAMPVIKRYMLIHVVVLGSIAGGTALLGTFVTKVLFGPRFQAVAGLLPWTMGGAVLFGMATAFAVFSYAARETVSLNIARGVSQVGYAVALLSVRPGPNPALTFTKLFTAANFVYLLMMIGFARMVQRRARPRVATTARP